MRTTHPTRRRAQHPKRPAPAKPDPAERVYAAKWPVPCERTDRGNGPCFAGDTLTTTTDLRELKQGDWAIASDGCNETRMGRIFYVDGVTLASGRYDGNFYPVRVIERMVRLCDAAGRERPINAEDHRERFEVALALVKFCRRREYEHALADSRKVAAALGRHFLADRRWRRRFYDLLYPTPTHNWELPRPRRSIRAKVGT